MTENNDPLSVRFPRQSRLVSVSLLLAAASLALGCLAPLMTFQKFFIFSDSVSLVSGLGELWIKQYFLLFAIIFSFSIVLPMTKLLTLAWLWHAPFVSADQHDRRLHILELIGKWSMLDVFVVALLVVSLKLATVARVEIRYGLYAFVAAVLLTMLITAYVRKLSNRATCI
jgi:paraquat-inducible protein A